MNSFIILLTTGGVGTNALDIAVSVDEIAFVQEQQILASHDWANATVMLRHGQSIFVSQTVAEVIEEIRKAKTVIETLVSTTP